MTSYDERITTYFGDPVLRAGFMPVPHLLMRHYRALDLLSEHAMFAMQLMEITWDLAQPPVTMRKIAERMGISVRTAQRYSEYLAARGLIVIYEQFEDGAQVENGYDLAPLFHALAAFAPEPGRAARRASDAGAVAPRWPNTPPLLNLKLLPAHDAPAMPVQPRPNDAQRHPAPAVRRYQPRNTSSSAPRDSNDILPGDTAVIPPGDISVTRRDDTQITPPHDPPVAPAPTPASGLKGMQEFPKKQQEQVGVAAAEPADDDPASAVYLPPTAAYSGRSLRLEHELLAADITRSARLLDRIGLHAPVARACAPTLAPAEVLALAVYARAASLGTGWIAAQIYDFERRAPRAAGLARRWDEAGIRLAALDDDSALRVLELVDRYAPGAPDALIGDACYSGGDEQVQAATTAAWALMHDVRGGEPATRTLSKARADAAAGEDTTLWRAVLERLRGEIPAPDYETWLQPARLLLLENDVAIVGTDNIFAREHILQAHGELLARAFDAERGRATRVDVVID